MISGLIAMNVVTKDADITSVFDEAVQAHNAGDLTAAEQLYQETLSLQPDHSEANHNIGAILTSKNELEDALKFFKFALDTSPNVSLFWASYIDVLIKLDRITESKNLITRRIAFNIAASIQKSLIQIHFLIFFLVGLVNR